MTSPASVGGDDRLRLFLALQLPGDVLDVLERWQAAQLGKGRLVAREALHVTLAFLGSRPSSELPSIAGALRDAAAGSRPLVLAPRAWRETRSVGMVVLSDAGGEAAALAGRLHSRLETLGVYRSCRFSGSPPRAAARQPRPRQGCDVRVGRGHGCRAGRAPGYEPEKRHSLVLPL